MARFVALLRGINVGKNNRIAMADLRQLLADAGYTDIRTHLQSGNALFDAGGKATSKKVAADLERAISERFGFDVKVVARTRDELGAVIAGNTLPSTDGAKLHVAFLDAAVDPTRISDVDPDGYRPEEFQLGERELYLWCANGVIQSKIMKVLTEKRLGRVMTARNWNTVNKLYELMAE
jgi:uncharacterized protein (DUF1697 family)